MTDEGTDKESQHLPVLPSDSHEIRRPGNTYPIQLLIIQMTWIWRKTETVSCCLPYFELCCRGAWAGKIASASKTPMCLKAAPQTGLYGRPISAAPVWGNQLQQYSANQPDSVTVGLDAFCKTVNWLVPIWTWASISSEPFQFTWRKYIGAKALLFYHNILNERRKHLAIPSGSAFTPQIKPSSSILPKAFPSRPLLLTV